MEILSINVDDKVKTVELFGKGGKKIAGVAGTLHVTDKSELESMMNSGWALSVATKKPVVVVLRAP